MSFASKFEGILDELEDLQDEIPEDMWNDVRFKRAIYRMFAISPERQRILLDPATEIKNRLYARSVFSLGNKLKVAFDEIDIEVAADAHKASEIGKLREREAYETLKYLTKSLERFKLWWDKFEREAEADHTGAYGRYLFAPERADHSPETWPIVTNFDVMNPPVPYEPNNDAEERLYFDIKQHFLGYKPLTKNTAKTLKHATQQGHYKDVLTPPEGKYAYRGIAVSVQDAVNVFKLDLQKDSGKKKIKLRVAPKAFSSWSLKLHVAKEFALSSASGKGTPLGQENKCVGIVLKVALEDTNLDSFVFNPKNMQNAFGFGHEHEVTQVDDAMVDTIQWEVYVPPASTSGRTEPWTTEEYVKANLEAED